MGQASWKEGLPMFSMNATRTHDREISRVIVQLFSFYQVEPNLSSYYITRHHITLHHMHIHIHMHCVWFLAGLRFSLLCPQDEVPRFQWTGCRKFFPEVTFKDLSNWRICFFYQIINFYFLPSRIRFGFLFISIKSTSSPRQAVLELFPPILLIMCRRFSLDIQSICLIKSNLLLIP